LLEVWVNVQFIVKPETLVSLRWTNKDETRVNVELVSRIRADLDSDRFRGKLLNCNQFAKVEKSSTEVTSVSLNPSRMPDPSRL
jgi:hypothetical protein